MKQTITTGVRFPEQKREEIQVEAHGQKFEFESSAIAEAFFNMIQRPTNETNQS